MVVPDGHFIQSVCCFCPVCCCLLASDQTSTCCFSFAHALFVGAAGCQHAALTSLGPYCLLASLSLALNTCVLVGTTAALQAYDKWLEVTNEPDPVPWQEKKEQAIGR